MAPAIEVEKESTSIAGAASYMFYNQVPQKVR